MTPEHIVFPEHKTIPSNTQETPVKNMKWKNSTALAIDVSTILTADEKLRVDAAGLGYYRTHHRSIPSEVINDVRSHTTSAVLISVNCVEFGDWQGLTRMVRELPRIPTIALLTSDNESTPKALLRLGQSGVHEVVDIRAPEGWKMLRGVLSDQCGDSIEKKMLLRLEQEIRTDTECWFFFESVIHMSRRVSSVRRLAVHLGVLPSTLMSRFFRAGLPAPKRYLAMTRLLRAAYLLENSGFSIANVANHLDYSSPQSFGRHVRSVLRMTALDFRHRYDGEAMLSRFVKELILPYRAILHGFNPVASDTYKSKPSSN